MSDYERLEALERRLAEAEEEIRILRARVAELEEKPPLRISQKGIDAIAEAAAKTLNPQLNQLESIVAGIVEAVKEIASVRIEQEQQGRVLDQLVSTQGMGLTTEFLLDIYEQRIAPTGKSLRGWLADIKALSRYEAVKTLRNRRKRDSN